MLTVCLGVYFSLLAVLYAAQIFSFILYAKDAPVLNRFLVVAVLLLILFGRCICGATARNSWSTLKEKFKSRGNAEEI